MKALKTGKRVLSLLVTTVVALTMIFSGSASAFAGTADETAKLHWNYSVGDYNSGKKISSPAYDGGYVYAVVNDGTDLTLKRFAEKDGAVTVLASLTGKDMGYGTIAPTVDKTAGKIYVPLTSEIAVIPLAGGTPEYVELINGYQTISPITYDDSNIYAAVWKSTSSGAYYKISKTDLTKTAMKDSMGFYWAGAAVAGDYVIFGSDGKEVYLYSKSENVIKDTLAVDGQVRSSVVSDGNGNYYFSTKASFSAGSLYKVSISSDAELVVAEGYPVSLSGGSTCTPVIENGKVYVGTDKKIIDIVNLADGKVTNVTAPAAVKTLFTMNGTVYASYNSTEGGIYSVTDDQKYFVPAAEMQGYNTYPMTGNGKDMLFFKNDSGNLMAISAKGSAGGSDDEPAVPDSPATDEIAEVNVTIADKGTLVMIKDKVTVSDIDKDGALTINDALYAAHEKNYNGGAAAGYASSVGAYGLAVDKLWGDTSGIFGYYVNNSSAWSLADPVKDGDFVNAFVYSMSDWSDKYSWFDKNEATVSEDEEITLTLNSAGYDAEWNPVTVPVAKAIITINGEATEYVTDENGKAVITFDKEGVYVISAVSEEQVLVPPVCKVTVTERAAAGSGDGEQTPDPDQNFGIGTQTGDDFCIMLFAVIALAALAATAVVRMRRI